jgi:hypothetical protein
MQVLYRFAVDLFAYEFEVFVLCWLTANVQDGESVMDVCCSEAKIVRVNWWPN